ncbi:hypothetical protein CEXT_340271 [Caerostris extrusa]|uniref:Uncharacterized protein n=1 Tax=Caerostris extrusa TaxID=172846 RepID=A0AAV4RBS2_CAEEX|nr:hypothetical protein CEXT_340271 [Caerostris extrusa]
MSRLGKASSFKEIPNVLVEDLKCSIVLCITRWRPKKIPRKRKTIIFQSAWRSENGCRSKSLPSVGSDENDASSFVRFGSTTNSLLFGSAYYF